ncbi:carbohydrate-binding module family 21 protein [Tilletiaria anomala UBC 951]|uniref:Carbohydrate-binding module family 21 protein n=1 Tax=Tilletiaria anomala (strain ATCC 24038 / CBS 436.72 / UBC 951) TaxID=1037660 RepID=A0A066VQW5_TILAU|nr:carbohydrate-binding module family 21 protein [Tilletiaria anomala UBC 951]KDN44142.1 carbohydrate-binding module family 21 protein [Tilletiaria anomala UBC 951]
MTPPLTPSSSPTSMSSMDDIQLASLTRLLQAQPQSLQPRVAADATELSFPIPAQSLRSRSSLPTLFRPTLASFEAVPSHRSWRDTGMINSVAPLASSSVFQRSRLSQYGPHSPYSTFPMMTATSEPLPPARTAFTGDGAQAGSRGNGRHHKHTQQRAASLTSSIPFTASSKEPPSLSLSLSEQPNDNCSGSRTNGRANGSANGAANESHSASTVDPPVAKATTLPAHASPSSTSSCDTISKPEDISVNTKAVHSRIKGTQRRPKMLRLTPAFSSAAPGPSQPSTKDAEKVQFPSREANAKTTSTAPLHPSSRKVLALKASAPSDAPPGLQLDLACLPVPSIMDKHNPASTSTLPDLVRKKSGEPVKSSLKHYPASAFPSRTDSLSGSMSRAKSVPNTPTIPKVVHFHQNLEQVKVFKHRQRPSAVSRDGSPEQTETETEEERDFPFLSHFGRRLDGTVTPEAAIPRPPTPTEGDEQLILRLPNFPSSAKLSLDRDIFLERVFLADDLRSVKGAIQVRNLAFEKWVAVRFTLDNWATVNEVSAEFSENIKDGLSDRFTFSIKLNELLNWPRGAGQHETKSMFLCLRYRTAGQEMWDNNGDLNYQLDFRKRPVPIAVTSTQPVRPIPLSPSVRVSGLPDMLRKNRSGHQMMEDLKKELSKLSADEDDGDQAQTPKNVSHDRTKRRSPPVSPGKRSGSPAIWSARYDFGESLKNPASGSRSTGPGRAAALDYFSSRMPTPGTMPQTSATSSSSTTAGDALRPPAPHLHAASISGKDMSFGMMSPGLGEMIKHEPTIHSATPSPNSTSALLTPTKYNTFPPGRSPLNPSWPNMAGDLTPQTPSPPRHQHQHLSRPQHNHTSSFDSASHDGSLFEFGSNLTSPVSPTGSPNALSPSASTTSLESETTEGFEANDSNSIGRLRSNMNASSDSIDSNASSMRPDSITSLEDLVARFCWNSDTLNGTAATSLVSSSVDLPGSGPPTPRIGP